MPKKNIAPSKSVKSEAKTPAAKASENKRKLKTVGETVVFWCNDGQIFRDIKDLMDGFDSMSDATFAYHMNDIKNDFSCWVLDIIGDESLAQDLKTVKNREQAKKKVQKRYMELTQQEG
jgi:hypothetical protein